MSTAADDPALAPHLPATLRLGPVHLTVRSSTARSRSTSRRSGCSCTTATARARRSVPAARTCSSSSGGRCRAGRPPCRAVSLRPALSDARAGRPRPPAPGDHADAHRGRLRPRRPEAIYWQPRSARRDTVRRDRRARQRLQQAGPALGGSAGEDSRPAGKGLRRSADDLLLTAARQGPLAHMRRSGVRTGVRRRAPSTRRHRRACAPGLASRARVGPRAPRSSWRSGQRGDRRRAACR